MLKLLAQIATRRVKINTQSHIVHQDRPNTAVFPVPRARGTVRVGVCGEKPQIDTLYQQGASKVMFPHSTEKRQAVLINTSGGVTGGDKFQTAASSTDGATLTLCTQTAERAYKAMPDQIGTMQTDITIGQQATLNWLPQETILFNDCALDRSLRVCADDSATFTLCEPVVFGRAAMGETLDAGFFRDSVEVSIDTKTIFVDRSELSGDIKSMIARPFLLNGAGAMVFLMHKSPFAETRLAEVRDLLPDTAGASLIHSDIIVVRALAQDSFELRKFLIPILTRLTGSALPRPWML